jgi:hypothetical protein
MLVFLRQEGGDVGSLQFREAAIEFPAPIHDRSIIAKGESMAVSKHLDQAAAKLKEAAFRIDEARQGPVTCENQKVWLEALTDYCLALTEVQSYNNESIHEKLHELAGRVGLRKFPGSRSPTT